MYRSGSMARQTRVRKAPGKLCGFIFRALPGALLFSIASVDSHLFF